jgi:hypothetical protein
MTAAKRPARDFVPRGGFLPPPALTLTFESSPNAAKGRRDVDRNQNSTGFLPFLAPPLELGAK